MYLKKYFLSATLLFMLLACSNDDSNPTGLKSVTIGTQVWTSKNLDVATYSDGTPIPEVKDPTAWGSLTTGAWCYYENETANGTIYGKLYNWYAVEGIHDNDPNTPDKQLAPIGWHVPTDDEYKVLVDYLGGTTVAGGKMKAKGTQYWVSPNTDATNSSGFTSLPGGMRGSAFRNKGSDSLYWTKTPSSSVSGYCRAISNTSGSISEYHTANKIIGFAVRCIKD